MIFFGLIDHFLDHRIGARPICSFATNERALGALGIIKIKNRSLGKTIDTTTEGVQRVALKMRWATFISRHYQRCDTTSARHDGRIKQRLAWNHPLNVVRVGQDCEDGAAATGHTQTHQTRRCTHHFEELTTRVFLFIRAERVTRRELDTSSLQKLGALLQLGHTAPVAFAGAGLFGVVPNAFHGDVF